MNTVLSVNADTQDLEFRGSDDPMRVYNFISKDDAMRLMYGIAEVYGIRLGDPKCPCKDKTPQTFDRYANRWRVAEGA